jgi:multiple sugar transport system substrate-binding protein
MMKWLAVCACALVAMFAVACGGDDKGSASSGSNARTPTTEPVTLTIWDWAVPDPAVTSAIDDAYMAEHPNVTIKRVVQDATTFSTLLRSAMAARKGPDIFLTFAGKYVLDFVSGTRQLDDLMSPGDEDQLKGWKAATALADGKHYVVPFDGGGTVIYTNKALFRKAGLDPEAPLTTWDEFLNACDKLKAAGIVPFSGGFKDGGLGELLIANFATQYIPDDEMDAFVANPDWTDPSVGKGFDVLRDLYDRGCFTPGSEGINLFPDVVNNFKAGKAAMTLGFTGSDVHWKLFRETSFGKDDDLGVMLYPLVPDSLWDEQRLQFGPAGSYAMTKWTKDPATAYDYMKFFTNKANAERLFLEAGSVPLNVDAKPEIDDSAATQIIEWVNTKETVLGGPIGAIGANVEGVLLRVIPQVVSGKATWDDVAGQVQAEQDKASK